MNCFVTSYEWNQHQNWNAVFALLLLLNNSEKGAASGDSNDLSSKLFYLSLFLLKILKGIKIYVREKMNIGD